MLDQLLGTPVQQTDVRIDAVHHLAIQFEDQAQDAMGGRMLRPEVDIELADFGFWHGLREVVRS
jgi:hypothetical protein